MRKFLKQILEFTQNVRYGYLFFSALIIIALVFGLFEIIEIIFFSNVSPQDMRWFYVSRGVLSSFFLFTWTAWTVFSYRQIYQKKLDKAESRYQDIIQNSADAIITLNNSNQIISWNKGAEQIFGWKENEIIDKSISALIPDHLANSNKLAKMEKQLDQDGYIRNYETERNTISGLIIQVQLTQTLIHNEQNDKIGSSLIMRDVTELRIKAETMQHSERLATLGHMAAGVAHEVGNPLTAISSLVQLLQRKTEDNYFQQNLTKIREQIIRINTIMRDLSDFSRPSSIDICDVQVNGVVKDAVGLLKHDARFRYTDFKLLLDGQLPTITVNKDQIHQVMVNLLINAVDAMESVPDPQITITTTSDNKKIYVRVKDNGKGIGKELHNKIFEPFFTTKPVGSGTGLGLSVSHGIISKMGGSIQVESKLGLGATFLITLPLKRIVS